MKMTITESKVNYTEQDGYLGHVTFEIDGHPQPYEATLHSTKGRNWSYGLRFAGEPGDEKLIIAVDDWLEEDDEAFERLIDAVRSKL